MSKENSPVIKVCRWITKYSIYTAVFLIPIFFLPWTAEVLEFNKQALLTVLLFVALFSWMVKILVLGKIELNISKIHIVVGALFLVYLLATIFSIYSYGSFWGWPQSASESLLSLILLILLYVLASNIFSKKDIFTSIIILSFSVLIAQIFGVLQILGLFIAPFSFAKLTSFNTIGSVGALGIFMAVMLPIAITLLIFSKKWWKILFISQIFLSMTLLLLINYSMVWWAVAIGTAIVMIFSVLKRNIFDGRWLALPMFFLAVSLFFIFLSPQIPGPTQKVNEIYLTQKASFKIVLQSLKERPIFGSGPGTFYYNFSKFKSDDLSKGTFWRINFGQANSKILNELATTGVLGFLAMLALISTVVFSGIKYIADKKSTKSETGQDKDQQKKYWTLSLGIVSALTVQSIAFLFYNTNIVLSFIYFFLAAGLVVFMAEEKREYELKYSSFSTLIITFAFTLAFIFGIGLVFLGGQRYVAEFQYNKGLSFLLAEDIDKGIKSIESAASINPSSDLYFRQLSQAYLAKLQQELQSSKILTNEQREKIQVLIANSINASKISTDINPKNAKNWTNRGFVYQSLSGLVNDANDWALNSYESAIQLDPQNPYLYMQEGIINFISASNPQTKTPRSQLLGLAKEKLEKSVSLNESYSNALYFLGLVYDALGDKNKAIESFTRVKILNPANDEISRILNNLKAGLPAIQQADLPPVETPPSSEDTNQNTVPTGVEGSEQNLE